MPRDRGFVTVLLSVDELRVLEQVMAMLEEDELIEEYELTPDQLASFNGAYDEVVDAMESAGVPPLDAETIH